MKVFMFFIACCAVIFYNASPNPLETVIKGPCECGVFDAPDAAPNQSTIFAQTIMNVQCNTNESTCHNICADFASSVKDDAHTIGSTICPHIEDKLVFQPSLYSRTCNEKWNYTGVTASMSICCENNSTCENFTNFVEPMSHENCTKHDCEKCKNNETVTCKKCKEHHDRIDTSLPVKEEPDCEKCAKMEVPDEKCKTCPKEEKKE